MNPSLDKALYYLTGNGNIDDVPVEDLEKLTKDYPFFSIGQLLLAKKMKIKEDKRYKKQLQTAALYISNPYWLHYQLLNYPPPEIDLFPASIADHHEDANQEDVIVQQDNKYEEQPQVINQENILSTDTDPLPIPSNSLNEEVEISEELEPVLLNGADTKDYHAEQVDVPITTEFTQEEIEVASELAHEQLGQTTEEELNEEETIPITTEFSQDEIETASEMAQEQLGQTTEEEFDEENVPITTEFSQEEIETASEMAHEQLGETTEEELDEENVPITTEFSQEEIETASELAHEHLGETGSEELIFHPGYEAERNPSITEVEPTLKTQDASVPGKQDATPEAFTGDQKEPKYINEFEPTIDAPHEPNKEVSQAEAEMAAITREPDKATESFIEALENEDRNHIGTTTIEDTTESSEPDEHEVMFQNIKAMLDATTEDASRGVEGATIPIDPYHTIDYFASQGIKLDFDQNPQDKLGKQVKKFTQWLIHMKKLGPEDSLQVIENDTAEADIQQIADTSNTAREVVTEAMAQVLEKQGKTAKAIQLYNKLSFLNPHKSAYFADKIKKLKDT